MSLALLSRLLLLSALEVVLCSLMSPDDEATLSRFCPEGIQIVGHNPENWKIYRDIGTVIKCDYKPKLLSWDLSGGDNSRVRACYSYETIADIVF
jgi:hypothetical protein